MYGVGSAVIVCFSVCMYGVGSAVIVLVMCDALLNRLTPWCNTINI